MVVCATGDSVSLATTPVADANVAWGGQDPTDVNRVGPRVSGILAAPTASHAFRLSKTCGGHQCQINVFSFLKQQPDTSDHQFKA